jgi:membrane protein
MKYLAGRDHMRRQAREIPGHDQVMDGGAGSSLAHKAWVVIADAVGHLNDDDGWAMASHVALSALMALFPFVIFVAALAGFIGDAALAGRAADILFEIWPDEVAGPIAREVHRVLTGASTGLLTISAVIAIYLASNGVEAVRTALNRAYRSGEARSFIFRRGQSLIFVAIGAAASLTLAFLGVLGPRTFARLAEYFPALLPFEASFNYVRIGVTSVLLIVVLVAAHLWLPQNRPPAWKLWPGIVATLTLWLIAARIFAAYLAKFANYTATYAGLASVVTAIFFLYLIALIMIFGAEFNAALGRLRAGKLR